jgi:hypothetical protein
MVTQQDRAPKKLGPRTFDSASHTVRLKCNLLCIQYHDIKFNGQVLFKKYSHNFVFGMEELLLKVAVYHKANK